MNDSIELRLGEEKPVRLPLGEWSHETGGMSSAVAVRKMWTAHPYPDDEGREPGASYMVYMIRGTAPGTATVRFTRRPDGESRVYSVTVRG